jgi:hypothetical protein
VLGISENQAQKDENKNLRVARAKWSICKRENKTQDHSREEKRRTKAPNLIIRTLILTAVGSLDLIDGLIP